MARTRLAFAGSPVRKEVAPRGADRTDPRPGYLLPKEVRMRHRPTALTAIAALFVALTAAASFAEEKKATGYGDINIKDLKAAIEAKNVTIIDVNGTDSYKDGHIPGAVDFDAVKDNLASALPKDKNALVVAYCGGPQCMAYKAAAEKAVAMGYTNVKHLPDGISGWKKAGEKTEKAS